MGGQPRRRRARGAPQATRDLWVEDPKPRALAARRVRPRRWDKHLLAKQQRQEKPDGGEAQAGVILRGRGLGGVGQHRGADAGAFGRPRLDRAGGRVQPRLARKAAPQAACRAALQGAQGVRLGDGVQIDSLTVSLGSGRQVRPLTTIAFCSHSTLAMAPNRLTAALAARVLTKRRAAMAFPLCANSSEGGSEFACADLRFMAASKTAPSRPQAAALRFCRRRATRGRIATRGMEASRARGPPGVKSFLGAITSEASRARRPFGPLRILHHRWPARQRRKPQPTP